MALGVVDGHAVGSDVDARGVGAADTQTRVTDAAAGIAGGHHRGRRLEQEGDVAAIVDAGDLRRGDVGKGHGSVGGGAVGHHLYVAEVDNGCVGARGLDGLRAHGHGGAQRPHACMEQMLHCYKFHYAGTNRFRFKGYNLSSARVNLHAAHPYRMLIISCDTAGKATGLRRGKVT